ncbi:MAG: ATP-dependent helicase HrpB [Akkermansiaceae bacterium]|nr:ATP-dependent helicase HrpB [Akkermansiaceae bacterium]MDG1362191.1 ATP-dependent helicase HrpB [Akkermansiaceae bacterium]
MRLPVNEVEKEIRASVAVDQGRLLLKAPTGSGKSTAVPGMVRGECEGQVVVVQPRRMAARLLAEFLAKQMGTLLGKGVGYAVRFENQSGPETEILFVTDGVLQRMLLDDPELSGVGAVVFDEFHERRLSSDLSLARVLDLQESVRPDLRVVVMSATLETGGLKDYLEPCRLVEAGGRMFPVEICHRGEAQVGRRGLNRHEEVWDRVAAAVKAEARELIAGDRILVFLPGMYEIRKSQSLLENAAVLKGWEVCPLYSALSPTAQRSALKMDDSKRIILATNVAETSVTIEGVKVVVDSGLVRQSSYDVARGFDSLGVVKIARAAADQRAGRAGRTGPGRCVRLWSKSDHRNRKEFETPEVRRVDLAEAILFLKRLGVNEITGFRWLDQPENERRLDAEKLLTSLGALDSGGRLMEVGKKMAALPLHPRLAALVLQGGDCLGEVLFVAAAVQGEGVFKRAGRGQKWAEFLEGEPGWGNDFGAEWLAMMAAKNLDFRPRECDGLGVLARGARETWKNFQQLGRLLKKRGGRIKEPDFRQRGDACARAMLIAFGDRLAVRRDQGSAVCHVVGGRKGKLHPKSVVRNTTLFLAADMIEVEGRERSVILSRCVEISKDWIPAEEINDSENVIFDEISRRVVAVKQRIFRGLVLEEKRGGEVDPNLAGELLAGRVIAGDLVLKKWDAKVERWIARLAFLSKAMPELEFPGFDAGDREMAIAQICAGATTFKEVKDRDPWRVLHDWLSVPQRQAMDSFAPEKITLENGVNTRVLYTAGNDPWFEEKVQRLYGVKETPTIANGHPLVAKILAPNQRPWQVTSDLPGFWERGFAQMKKDLAGRYPKHNWDGRRQP